MKKRNVREREVKEGEVKEGGKRGIEQGERKDRQRRRIKRQM